MTIEAIKAFSNTPVGKIIKKEKITEGEKIPKVLLQSEEREKLIPIFLQKIAQFPKEKWAFDVARKFHEKFLEHGKDLPGKLKLEIRNTLEIFNGAITHKTISFLVKRDNEKTCSKLTPSPLIGIRPFHDFPLEWCTLAELKTKLKDPDALDALFMKLTLREKVLDQRLINTPREAAKAKKELCPYSYPYDFNRAGKDIKGLFINASFAEIGGRQSYLLGTCPKTIEDAQNTFDVILKEGVRVLISLHQSKEIGPTGDFWAEKVLSKLTLRDGWKIHNLEKDSSLDGTKAFAKKLNEEKKNPSDDPQIIERHLLAERQGEKREIVHLHYKDWHDCLAAPIPLLMNTLLDRKDEISPSKEIPIWINCKAGIGRTGAIALLDLSRREVKEQLKAGTKLEEVSINIPALLYRLRQERASALSNPKSFLHVYQCMVDFMESLQSKNNELNDLSKNVSKI